MVQEAQIKDVLEQEAKMGEPNQPEEQQQASIEGSMKQDDAVAARLSIEAPDKEVHPLGSDKLFLELQNQNKGQRNLGANAYTSGGQIPESIAIEPNPALESPRMAPSMVAPNHRSKND